MKGIHESFNVASSKPEIIKLNGALTGGSPWVLNTVLLLLLLARKTVKQAHTKKLMKV